MLRPALVLLCLSLFACGSDDEASPGADTGTPDTDGSSAADTGAPDVDEDTDTGTPDSDAGEPDADADPDADVAPDAAAPGPTLEEACEAISASTCAAVFACECPTDTVLGYTDEADCTAQRITECLDGWPAEARTAFEDGSLVWILENLDACIEGREAQFDTCSFDENVGDPRCTVVYSEPAPVGEACRYGGFAACANGAGYCNVDGICVAKQGEGNPATRPVRAPWACRARMAPASPPCPKAAPAPRPSNASPDCNASTPAAAPVDWPTRAANRRSTALPD
jgi:hypothetical protein